MSTTIVMPQLGESVAEGVIGKWLKAEGDRIERDEPIVEVITDKVNAEIPAPVAGVLQRIIQPEGATVTVGEPIAEVGESSEGNGGSRPEATEQPASAGAGTSGSGDGSNGGGGSGQPRSQSATATAPQANAAPPAIATETRDTVRAERVRSSPLVRRLADEYGINLAEVPGTGIGGRVSKADIMSFIERREQAPTAARVPEAAPAEVAPAQAIPAPQPATAGRQPLPNEEWIPVSPLRKMIADRMVQSKFTIPHATTVVEVDMTACVRYRGARKDEFREREGVPLSIVAFVIKATVDALKTFTMVNAEWAGDHIVVKKDININVAVNAPDGLTTPVIHQADEMSLAGLSKAIYDLAVRGRDKRLKIEDMQGGTFTVNNTGALGSINGVSIINYPQAGILSAAAIVKRPVVIDVEGEDVVVVRHMMNMPFTFDHRLLDGGSASQFLNAVKATLESWPADYPLY